MRIGVDTGGTFTDFIALDGSRCVRAKLPSTPHDPGEAVVAGVERLDPEQRAAVTHGTTVATNALLERRLARVTFVTNRRIEDVLEIGRQSRPDLYALAIEKPEPLVPRDRRIGVAQRTSSSGVEDLALTRAEIERLRKAVAKSRPEAIAIGLLFSFLDDRAEQELEAALRPLGVPITRSAAIAPSIREFERFSTAVANAALVPVVGGYLDRLEARLAPRPLFVFQSNGGLARSARVAREPVKLVLSGPAGGAVAAATIARRSGIETAIALDMGGTSTDVALIRGRPLRRSEIEFAAQPLLVPSLDIESVGAGGGSIAWVDEAGLLRVGPRSAGAVPGPACYGRGEAPTVTDAHVLLGRMPLSLAGGVELDVDRAASALERLGRKLGLSAIATAEAVLELADAAMARAARVVAVNRGVDPRDVELIAFGGAGGLHAARLIRELPCRGAVVPPMPGHLSAFGMVIADPEVDLCRTVLVRDPERSAARRQLSAALRALEAEAREHLRQDFDLKRNPRVDIERTLQCRYAGQSFTLEIPFAPSFRRDFDEAHAARFGHAFPDHPIEVVDVAVRVRRPPESLPLSKLLSAPTRGSLAAAHLGDARTIFGGKPRKIPRFLRSALPRGARIPGPARIEDDGATLLLEPGSRATIDHHGNVRIENPL